MIVNDNSRFINKLDASLTDDTRVIIYDRHMFIEQVTVFILRGAPTFNEALSTTRWQYQSQV